MNSAPPLPPRRAALAPAVHPPETLHRCRFACEHLIPERDRPSRQPWPGLDWGAGRGGAPGRRGGGEGAREGVAPERPTHLAAEQLVRVRSWWCAEPTRGLEPRCVKGVVWADGQRGLHAIWSLFCTQAQHA